MLQSNIYNDIFEQTSIDDRVFESVTNIELNPSNFIQDQKSKPHEIIFSTDSVKNNNLLIQNGMMLFTLEFSRLDEADIIGSDKIAIRNSSYSIFDSIQIQLSDSNHTIEQITNCSDVFNIKGLIEYTDDQCKSFLIQSNFYPDKAINSSVTLSDSITDNSFNSTHTQGNLGLVLRSQFVKNNKIHLCCKLNELPFFKHYTGLFLKSRIRILLRPNYNNPIVRSISTPAAGKQDGLTYHFTNARLIIPEVKLRPKYESNLLEKINKGFIKKMSWMSLNIFSSEQIYPVNTTNINATISSEVKKASKLYILFCKSFDEDASIQKKSTQIYNGFNITSATLLVNNKICFQDSNISFTDLNVHIPYERLYNMFVQCRGCDLSGGSLISYLDFCKMYRVLAYDFNTIDDKSIYNSMGNESISVGFKCTLDANSSDKLKILYIFDCEKELCFDYKNDRCEINLINV